MQLKSLIAAAAITAFAGSAFAQATSAVGEGEPPYAEWGSQQEQILFETHGETMGGFFTDDTFAELAPAADFEAAWAGMTPEDQQAMLAECEQIGGSPAEYRDVTVQFCEQIGAL